MHSVTRGFVRVIQAVVLTVLAVQVLAASQGADAKRVLTELRAALGGEDKLAAVKTLSVQGQTARVAPDGSTTSSSDFEWAMELPSKFVKREMFANLGGQKLYRRVGFNGPDVIEENDMPSGMTGGAGGHTVVRTMSPGMAMPGGKASPEQVAAQKALTLANARRDFARLTLGMFGSSFSAFPVEFSYAGQAEAPDGKADVLEVRGADGFVAKFFVDGKSRLPLMLSWMDKEPLRMTMGPGGSAMSAGNVQVFSGNAGAGRTPEDVARMQQEMADRMKEAEANRRTVEYRMFYTDYKTFNGVKLPTKIQRMMDGLPTEELSLENIKVNSKIDASRFQPAGK